MENTVNVQCFSTLRILATVKPGITFLSLPTCFSTLRILATVKRKPRVRVVVLVLVPLEF